MVVKQKTTLLKNQLSYVRMLLMRLFYDFSKAIKEMKNKQPAQSQYYLHVTQKKDRLMIP